MEEAVEGERVRERVYSCIKKRDKTYKDKEVEEVLKSERFELSVHSCIITRDRTNEKR